MKFLERDHWNLPDNWGTWIDKKMPDDTGVEFPGEPGLANAIYKVGLAMFLTKRIAFRGRERTSVGELLQEKLLAATNKLQKNAGVPGEVVLPTYENIQNVFSDVYDEIKKQLPPDISTYEQLNEEKAKESNVYLNRLKSGEFDDGTITEDEQAIVRQILIGVGHKSAEELRNTLDDAIYGRAMDIVSAEKTNRLVRRDGEFKAALKIFDEYVPKKWVMADLVTTEVLMTASEQKELENVIWTVTPKDVIVRNISSNEDVVRIPLERFSSEDEEPIYIQDGTLDVVDVLRRRSTRLFQPLSNMFLEERLGGVLVFRDYRRDTVLSKISVRAHKATSKILARLGHVAHGYERTQEMTEKAVDEIDASPKSPLRPNVIENEFPTKLLFVIDATLNEDGTVNWHEFLQGVEKKKREILKKKLEAAVTASPFLDENIKPERLSDIRTIGEIDAQLVELQMETKKVNDQINKAGEKKREGFCSSCRQPLSDNHGCGHCGAPSGN